MKAKKLLLLCALLAPLFTLTAHADDPVEVGGIYYNLVPKGKIATVTKKEIQKQDEWGNPYTEYYSGPINIPGSFSYGGTTYTVVGIEDNAFSNASVTSVAIPNTVMTIGQNAFNNCSSLTSVTIPESVTSIGESTFSYCRSLTTVTIPESVTSIGEYAFSYCSGLTSVTIPESVTCIDRDTFSGCSSLTSVTIPESVTSIEDNAFQYCSSLTSIVLPNVSNVYAQAFYGCTQLRSVTMPIENGPTYISSKAFANCSNLEEFNVSTYWRYQGTEPNEIAYVSSDAFEGSFVEYATLHVPEAAIGLYKADATWGKFGTITSLGSASKYYKLFVEVNEKGKVMYGEAENVKTITGATQTFDVKEQEDIVLTLTANDGYKLDKVTVNGVDKTSAVTAEGKLTISSVTGDQTVNVAFVLDGNSVAVTIGELGAATFCCTEALDFSGTDDVKAYIVSAFQPSTGKVTLTRITDVPAGTGIVVLGEAGTYDIPLGAGQTYVMNMLVGTTAAKTLNKTEGANSNFILADGENGVGFYAVSSGSTLDAGKAYLALPTSALPTNAQSIGLRFGDGTTNVRSMEKGELDNEAGAWFTIDGRRLDAQPTTRGLYIVNGKKVIVK